VGCIQDLAGRLPEEKPMALPKFNIKPAAAYFMALETKSNLSVLSFSSDVVNVCVGNCTSLLLVWLCVGAVVDEMY
jgi:hypothetical protein